MDGIKERLARVREKLGESQKSMSSRFGLGVSTWQGYELEGRLPKTETLTALADLGFNIQWLLTGDGPMMVGSRDYQALADQALAGDADAAAQLAAHPESALKALHTFPDNRFLDQLFGGYDDAVRAMRDDPVSTARALYSLTPGRLPKNTPMADPQREPHPTPADPAPAAMDQALDMDPELMARVTDTIWRAYRDAGAQISPMDLGRLTAIHYRRLSRSHYGPPAPLSAAEVDVLLRFLRISIMDDVAAGRGGTAGKRSA